MKLVLCDMIIVDRVVEIPNKCPNPECGEDLTAENAIREGCFEDRFYAGTFVGSEYDGTPGSIDYDHETGTGDMFIPTSFSCRFCGAELATAGVINFGADPEPTPEPTDAAPAADYQRSMSDLEHRARAALNPTVNPGPFLGGT